MSFFYRYSKSILNEVHDLDVQWMFNGCLPLDVQLDKEKQTESAVLEELRCPVCAYYMCPPIYLCNKGHSICEDCFKKVKVCPKCRGSKSNAARNYSLEAIHDKWNIPCKYAISGCDIVLQGEYIKQHQRFCTYASIYCPFRFDVNCQWKNHRGRLQYHLENRHFHSFYVGERQKFRSQNFMAINKYHFICAVIYAYKQFFRLTWDINEVTGMTRWTVYFMGSPDEAMTYRYKLEFSKSQRGPEAISPPMMFKSVCGPLPERENVKFEDHNCFYAHRTLLNKYCNDNGELNYKVIIYNLKEERVSDLSLLFSDVKLEDDQSDQGDSS